MTGKEFEQIAQRVIFNEENIHLQRNFKLPIGISNNTKAHNFDLGNAEQKVLVECKCHSWTTTGNNPSAKMSIWNEAMFYFLLAPKDYRKILFVRSHFHDIRELTLAQYYIKTFSHFIPENVEIWEYDYNKNILTRCERHPLLLTSYSTSKQNQ